MSTRRDYVNAVWRYPVRLLDPSTPEVGNNAYADAVWAYPTRTLMAPNSSADALILQELELGDSTGHAELN